MKWKEMEGGGSVFIVCVCMCVYVCVCICVYMCVYDDLPTLLQELSVVSFPPLPLSISS